LTIGATGDVDISSGSLTGGASGLTLNAGGTNQNITLTPGGTGKAVLPATATAPRFEVAENTVYNDSAVAFSVDSSTRQWLFNMYSGGNFRMALTRSTGTLQVATTGKIGWATSAPENTLRTALSENAEGVVEINNGTAGTYRDLRTRSVIQQPPASITPASNGDLVFEATSNTSVTLKLKGTDGTVRSVVLTLAP